MTRRPPLLVLALAALAVAGLGACGSSSKSGSGAVTKTAAAGAITVGAYDVRFDVKVIKATTGPLTVTFVNHGAMEHTFKIEGTSMLLKADGGKTTTGTVTLAKGTYKFECTVPGHAQQGMNGTVDVS